MKKRSCLAFLLIGLLCFTGCRENTPGPAETTVPTSQQVTLPSVEQTTAPSEPETTAETQPVATGWQEIDGQRYYYDDRGVPMTGWLELENGRYYLGADGVMHTGWLQDGEKRFYFAPDGVMCTGQTEIDGKKHYFDTDGKPMTGWLETDGQRYYLNDDGSLYTGWLEDGDSRYYFLSDGSMARGAVSISPEETRYFSSLGKEVILVNPWNFVPDDYTTELTEYEGWTVSADCAEDLKLMLDDCAKAGHEALVTSAYRTHEYQKGLFERRIQRFLDQGYSQEKAREEAAKRVAYPGTSEHELGLAVDIVDKNYQNLTQQQEQMDAQKWLIANSWRYGFILRYPNNKTEVTGIIYEPWHYRYVGRELAAELHELGLCLEEYFAMLTPAPLQEG